MAADPVAGEVEAFYENCRIINEAKDKKDAVGAYQQVLAAVKGSTAVKQLAAQSIPRFFAFYEDLQDEAINALIDLCEDESLQIRVHAIRGLAQATKAAPKVCGRTALVVAQLIVADDALEQKAAKDALQLLFSLDAAACFGVLVNHIETGGDERLRQASIAYLQQQMQQFHAKIAQSTELQTILADGIKRILESEAGVTAKEFELFVGLLQKLPIVTQDPEWPKKLGEITARQAGLNKEFDPSSEESVSQYLSCLSATKTISQRGNVDITPFVSFFFTKILPAFSSIADKFKLLLLQAMADSVRGLNSENARLYLEPVLSALKQEAPNQAEIKQRQAAAAPAENGAASGVVSLKEKADIKLNFSNLEALLVAFHELAGKSPAGVQQLLGSLGELPAGQPPDVRQALTQAAREDLLERMRFLADHCKTYAEGVNKAIENMRTYLKDEKKTEEEKKTISEKLKAAQKALRTVQNVQKLATAICGKNPKLGFRVTASWTTLGGSKTATAGKRKREGEDASGAVEKKQRPLYTPPPKQGAGSDIGPTGQPGEQLQGTGRGRARGRGRGRGRATARRRGGALQGAANRSASRTRQRGVAAAGRGGRGRGRGRARGRRTSSFRGSAFAS